MDLGVLRIINLKKADQNIRNNKQIFENDSLA